jgi:hypothetical protein
MEEKMNLVERSETIAAKAAERSAKMTQSGFNEFLKDTVEFITLEDGESFEGKYLTAEFLPTGGYKGAATMDYSFEKLDRKYSLKTTSKTFAQRMEKVAENTNLKITRYGTGPDTKYDITALSADHVFV